MVCEPATIFPEFLPCAAVVIGKRDGLPNRVIRTLEVARVSNNRHGFPAQWHRSVLAPLDIHLGPHSMFDRVTKRALAGHEDPAVKVCPEAFYRSAIW
jgi:hypothetical protein